MAERPIPAGNLFAGLEDLPQELEHFNDLLTQPGLRIERIVSHGQASPPGFWYEQAEAEWVLLICGTALLRFEDEPQSRQLLPGDHLLIAPYRRHRVERTAEGEATIWLAVWFDAN